MKTKLSLLFVAAIGLFAQAQDDDCIAKIALLKNAAKEKNPEAYTYFNEIRKNCPSASEASFLYGEHAVRQQIVNNEANASEKEKYARELMKVFEEFKANFPGSKRSQGVDMKKGLVLFDYKLGTHEEIYQLLDNAFKNDLANFNSPRALYAYFEIFVNDYKAGKKGITLQQVFDKYDDVSDHLAILQKENSETLDAILNKEEAGEELNKTESVTKKNSETAIEDIAVVIPNMDAIVIELSTCERLIPFYQEGFEQNKTNESWLKRAADRLEAKECDNSPLFTKISEALYKLNPSADAAYKFGIVEKQRGNTAKALEYFNQAANMFDDNTKKAKVYMTMASMYKNSSKSQARSYAEKALQVKPSYGNARLFIAGLYGSSINDAGGDQFERRAIYWLAAQEADKAAAIDPSVRAEANRYASQYRAAAPTRTDIFSAGKAGQQICFKGWIGKCITVPSL